MCVRLAVLVDNSKGSRLELERQEFTRFLTVENQPPVHDVGITDVQNICQIDAARQVAEQEQVLCQLQERFGVLGQRPHLAIHNPPNILFCQRPIGRGFLESAHFERVERVVRFLD